MLTINYPTFENITKKINHFKLRRSLVHFYFLIRKKTIRTSANFFNAIDKSRFETNIIKQYLIFETDENFDNVNFDSYAKDLTNELQNCEINNEDIDFILKNREKFIVSFKNILDASTGKYLKL